jgi:sec-independent protein translocase protein TatA
VPNIGPLEIAIVLIIVLIIFGPKRLPELGRSMGRGIREFKSSISGDDDKDEVDKKRAELGESKVDAKAEPVEGEVVSENKA